MTARLLAAAAALVLLAAGRTYEGSSFSAVRDAVWRGPYAELPHYTVDMQRFGPEGEGPDNRLRAAALRTLTSREDLIDFPDGRKIVQPNGICFTGEWHIGPQSRYTGLFAPNTRVLVIARASVAYTATEQGERRAFGLAVKLFPTGDPDRVVKTLNVFTMEALVGTMHAHFLDASLDNAPGLGGIAGAYGNLELAMRMRDDFSAADAQASHGRADFGYRPVTPLARSGIPPGDEPVSPHWLQLRIADGTPRIDAADFRDELRVGQYPDHELTWRIEAADANSKGISRALFYPIGELVLNESVVSPGCDGRLHFAHPPLDG